MTNEEQAAKLAEIDEMIDQEIQNKDRIESCLRLYEAQLHHSRRQIEILGAERSKIATFELKLD